MIARSSISVSSHPMPLALRSWAIECDVPEHISSVAGWTHIRTLPMRRPLHERPKTGTSSWSAQLRARCARPVCRTFARPARRRQQYALQFSVHAHGAARVADILASVVAMVTSKIALGVGGTRWLGPNCRNLGADTRTSRSCGTSLALMQTRL